MKYSLFDKPVIWNVSEVTDGNMSFVTGLTETVLDSRLKWFEQSQLDPKSAVCMQVEHKDKIVVVDQDNLGKSLFSQDNVILADALITPSSQVSLFLLTADCLPIVIYDSDKKVLSLVHVGWRNLEIELLPQVINTLKEVFSCQSENLYVGIGPGIAKESYIQTKPSQLHDVKWQGYLERIGADKYLIDLKGLACKQILDQSVPSGQVFDVKIDTFSHAKFFSHYQSVRDKTAERRFATVVKMV